jgi:hypothetical protein
VFEQVGQFLFASLFDSETLQYLRDAQDQAHASASGLRILLHLENAPRLASRPWEFLYDPKPGQFMAMSRKSPIVRFPDQQYTPIRDSLRIDLPLRMLIAMANPADHEKLGLDPIDTQAEWVALQGALAGVLRSGHIVVERLEPATLEELRRRTLRQDFHILHFIGHGFAGSGNSDGELVFVDDYGSGHLITGYDLARELADRDTLRLVVLNCCHGASATRRDPSASAARRLVRIGIPAVIGMQFAISNTASTVFSRELYAALVAGEPVEAALAEARKAMDDKSGLEWATPVLYVQSAHGVLWQLPAGGEADQRAAEAAALKVHTVDLIDRGDFNAARTNLERLRVLDPDDRQVEQDLDHVHRQLRVDEDYENGLEHAQAGRWAVPKRTRLVARLRILPKLMRACSATTNWRDISPVSISTPILLAARIWSESRNLSRQQRTWARCIRQCGKDLNWNTQPPRCTTSLRRCLTCCVLPERTDQSSI